jgi:hypothetical protein
VSHARLYRCSPRLRWLFLVLAGARRPAAAGGRSERGAERAADASNNRAQPTPGLLFLSLSYSLFLTYYYVLIRPFFTTQRNNSHNAGALGFAALAHPPFKKSPTINGPLPTRP